MNLTRHYKVVFLFVTLFVAWQLPASGRQFFAATDGLMNNPGTFSQPWALDTALRMPATRVTAGDTIWIRGGVYKGAFTVKVAGSTVKPVVLQAYPGEKVVLDSYTGINNNVITLSMEGNYVWLVDVEVSNSSPTRVSNGSSIGSATDLHQATGINVFGTACKIINSSIHDVPGTGIGYWSTALDAEVYGCFLYYNGLSALDRGHGPQFYIQNSDKNRPKAIRNCFLFTGFSTGVQFYASATSMKLQGLIIDSNTIFNSGALTRVSQARRDNIVVGAPIDNDVTNASPNATRVDALYISNNTLYRDTTDNMTENHWHHDDYKSNTTLGFGDETLTDKFVSFTNNHLYGDPLPLLVHQWDSGVFRRNFVYSYRSNNTGNRQLIVMENASTPFSNWDSNTYHINQPGFTTPFSNLSFANWKTNYGIDANSSFNNAHPSQNFVFNRRNKYRPNSFYVTVMNYQQLDSVQIADDFSAFTDMRYAVYDVQLSTTRPLLEQLYSGQPIRVPMKLNAVAPTMGTVPAAPRHSSATLGTFILVFYPKVVTVKSGDWNDASVWNTGKVPTHFDDVEVNHTVTVNNHAWCRSLTGASSEVHVNSGAYLLVANTGK